MAPLAAARHGPLDAKRIAVIGAGRMGSSIAEWLALSRISVTLCSRNQENLTSFRHRVERYFTGKARRKRLSESEASAALERVHTARGYDGLDDVDFVIECVVEDLDVKRAVFQEVSRETSSTPILCSNTSSLSVSEIRGDGIDPTRVLGTHFFQPVRFTPVVEVVRGESTSADAASRVDALLRETGKTPIHVRDCPGFLVNRMLAAYLIASARLARERRASPGRIDRVLRDWGMQLGPFEVANLVGFDLVLAIARRLEIAYGDRFRIEELLGNTPDGKPWLEALDGDDEGTSREGREGRCADESIVDETIGSLVREALTCVREGVASEEDVELAAVECLRMPTGPLELARQRGIDERDEHPRPLTSARGPNGGKTRASLKATQERAPRLEIERKRDVTILTLNAPPRNSLTWELLEQFQHSLDRVENDGTRALVITGSRRVFSTGVDPAELSALRTPEEGRRASRRAQSLLHRIECSTIPVIAAINGLCLGGGLELALACHFRFCGDRARLGLPEIQLGVIPGMGGTQRLPRLLGSSRALEMILLGDTIKADRAAQVGLVHRVVPRRDLLGEVLDFAQRLAARDPPLVAAALRAVVEGVRLPLEAGLALEAETFGRLAAAAKKEGLRPAISRSDIDEP